MSYVGFSVSSSWSRQQPVLTQGYAWWVSGTGGQPQDSGFSWVGKKVIQRAEAELRQDSCHILTGENRQCGNERK